MLGGPELIVALLGTGGIAGTIGSLIQARRTIKAGARLDERGVLADSERWRRGADDARRHAEHDAAWWRDRAVELWLGCAQHGGEPGPLGSPPRFDPRK
jgi:hypothetical protein